MNMMKKNLNYLDEYLFITSQPHFYVKCNLASALTEVHYRQGRISLRMFLCLQNLKGLNLPEKIKPLSLILKEKFKKALLHLYELCSIESIIQISFL